MQIREQNLEPWCFYHIYNRGINGQCVFLNDEHFSFFLRKAKLYLIPYFEIYAYCLMRNHFHFLLRVKEIKDENIKNTKRTGLHSAAHLHSKQLGKFLSAYTQALNKIENRHGPLFESPFKRIRIEDETYLRNLIIYIHQNPLHTGEPLENYPYSSYKACISSGETAVEREKVIAYFNDVDNFIGCHRKIIDLDF